MEDVLPVQVSYVASESMFSTSGRILYSYRSCLTPYMIEVFICLQQWLRNCIHAEKIANLVQMFEELDFHESLGKPFNSSINSSYVFFSVLCACHCVGILELPIQPAN